MIFVLHRLRGNSDKSLPSFCSRRNFRDNIAGEPMENMIAFDPIDVVYTWVNGSDPVWLKKKELWTKRYHGITDENDAISGVNGTVSGIAPGNGTDSHNTTSSSAQPTEEDETMSNNRYRDSEELRYSLRSLMMNAPWIHHIYLVTDNQIPYWLNLETDRLTVVTHEEIFPNKSNLPVFSSPAIEANLHRIPGLSKKFIYFNDDVFLGAPVVPDDFVSLSGAQKLYMAWEVPKCAPGCSDSWIGDGFCDRACNVSACNFDFPDCINGTNARTGSAGTHDNKAPVYCLVGCPDGWLGDKVCDQRCKNEDCGWDFGDCGIDLVLDNFSGVDINRDNSILSSDVGQDSAGMGAGNPAVGGSSYYGPPSFAYYGGDFDSSEGSTEMDSSDGTDGNSTASGSGNKIKPSARQPALTVPYGTKAVYFNLTYFPCRFYMPPNNTVEVSSNATDAVSTTSSSTTESIATECFVKNMTNFKFSSADHDDYQNEIIHQPTILTKLNMLMVTLYHGQENAPMPSVFPHTVTFNVWGSDDITGAYVSLSFKLMITKPVGANDLRAYLPGGSSITNTEIDILDTQSAYLSVNGVVTDTNMELLKVPTGHVFLQGEIASNETTDTVTDVQSTDVTIQQQGIVLSWFLTKNHSDLLIRHSSHGHGHHNHHGRLLTTLITVSLRNTSVYTLKIPLCALLTEFYEQGTQAHSNSNSEGLHYFHTNSHRFCRADSLHGYTNSSTVLQRGNVFYQKYLASSLASMHVTTPPQNARLKERRKSILPGVLLSIPIPVPWAQFPRDFVHVKAEIYSSPVSSTSKALPHWQHRVGGQSYFSHNTDNNDTVTSGLIGESEHRVSYLTVLVPWGSNDTSIVSFTADTVVETVSIVDSVAMNATVAATTESTNSSIPETDVNSDALVPTSTANETIVIDSPIVAESLPTNETKIDDFAASSSNITSSGEEFPVAEATNGDEIIQASRRRLEVSNTASQSWFEYLSTLIQQSRVSLASIIAHSLGLSLQPRQEKRRRLIDTYAQSLIHVNRMYNKEFGVETRKVPAHVPHMIDRDLMQEMQDKWPTHWNETSSHRFRSSTDMQYSFSYYYYIMHRHKIRNRDYYGLVESVVDKDHDGFLNDNEFRTLMAMILHRSVQQDDINDSLTCIANYSSYIYDISGSMDHNVIGGKLHKSLSLRRFPTIAQVINCTKITDLLKEKFDWSSRSPNVLPSMLPDKDIVAFEMIGDNFTDALHQLDSIRARQSKFICVNDNMKNPSDELVKAMKDFFHSFYPFPSIFELQPIDGSNRKENPTLYVDEYRQWRKSKEFERQQWKEFVHKKIFLEGFIIPLKDKLVSLAKITIRMLDDEVVVVDEESVLIKRMERDLLYNPYGTPSTSTSPSTSTGGRKGKGGVPRSHNQDDPHPNAHIGLLAGVIGLVAVLCLRAAVRGGYSEHDSNSDALAQERTRALLERLEQESLAAAIAASQEDAATHARKFYQDTHGEKPQPTIKRKTVSYQDDRAFNHADYEQEMLEAVQNEPYVDQGADDEDIVVRNRYEQGGLDRTPGGLMDQIQYDDLLRQSAYVDDDESSSVVELAKRLKRD